MNFNKLAINRRSVRNFTSEKVTEDLIIKVLEAGRIAPSAVNYQPYIFIVVDDAHLLNEIYKSYPREWFSKAKQIIIVCANHNQSWKRPSDNKDHADIDAAIAADHITLQAAELRLGTCWVCNFNAEILSKALNLPSQFSPVVMLPIGYPADTPPETKKRKSIDELYFKNGKLGIKGIGNRE